MGSEPLTPLSAACDCISRGWAPIPVPIRTKAPTLRDWQRLDLIEDALPRYFPNENQNVGVLLGRPTGGPIDVDLD